MKHTGIGILFDMDGVIVDSNPVHKQAIHQFCKEHGKVLTETFFRKHISGRTNKEWIPHMFSDIGPEAIEKLSDEKERLFRSMFSPEDHLLRGLTEFLDAAQSAGMAMVVATSAPSENAEFILSRTGVRSYFDAVLTSSHVRTGKPHPDIYLKSAEAVEKVPGECVVIEDSLAGVEAAKSAGASVIGVTTSHIHEELSSCNLIINDFRELNIKELEKLVPDILE